MKSIYDEAIKSLSNICKEIRQAFNFPLSLTAEYRTITDALERAKKVEELLGLYQYLNENTNDYDLNPDEVDEIHNKIYELEEELK